MFLTPTPLNTTPGYRLRRFEIKNFGGYHGRAAIFNFNCEGAVLTGDNGVGKSTMIDAWRLIFNNQPNFNSAGQDSKDRSTETYYLGRYGRKANGQASDLRIFSTDKTVYMGICAVFEDHNGETFSAVRLFHYAKSGSSDQRFLTVKADVSLDRDFPEFPTRGIAARFVEGLSGISHDTQRSFFNRMGQQFGLTDWAHIQETFKFIDKSIGTKTMGSITEFAQTSIFPKIELEEKTDSAIKAFKTLQDIRQKVERLKQQQTDLEIVCKAIETYERSSDSLAARLAVQQRFDQFRHIVAKIDNQMFLKTKIKEYTKIQHLLKQAQILETTLTDEIAGINRSIADKGYNRLADLEKDLKHHESELVKITHQKTTFLQNLTALNLNANISSQSDIDTRKAQIATQLKKLEADDAEQRALRDAVVVEIGSLTAKVTEAADRVKDIKNHRTSLDGRLVTVRDTLCETLGISKEEAPFVAELIQIKDDSAEWEGAANRVLGAVGAEILIDSQYDAQASRLINSRNWGAKIVIQKISDYAPSYRKADPRALSNTLDVNEDSKFADVAHSIINERARHICVSAQEFETSREDCVTVEGSIKNGSKIIKDDKNKIGDKRSFTLGWNMERAMEAAQKDYTDLVKEQEDAQTKRNEFDAGAKFRKERISSYTQFLNATTTFEDIDTSTTAHTIQALQKEIKGMNSPEFTNLKAQLVDKETQIKKIKSETTDLFKKEGGVKTSIDSTQTAIQRKNTSIQSEIQKFGLLEREQRKIYIGYLRDTLNTPITENTIKDIIGKHPQDTDDKINSIKNAKTADPYAPLRRDANNGTKSILKFFETHTDLATVLSKECFPAGEDLNNMMAKQAREEWKAKLAKIKFDDVVKNEEDYKQQQKEGAPAPIAAFSTAVEDYEKDIFAMIAGINDVLSTLIYDPVSKTRVRLKIEKDAKNKPVLEFRECLGKSVNAVHSGDFEEIEEMVEKLLQCVQTDGTEASEKRRVALMDLRTWFTMTVEEYTIKDDGSTESYRAYKGKDGLSGGQGERLTMLMLGAAMRHTFKEDDKQGKTAGLKTIILDEAFNKATQETASAATKILIDLGLQVIIATPFEKVQVLAGHDHRIFLTAKHKEQASITQISYAELDRKSKEDVAALERGDITV
jgi:uncharacterized protein YPO0396